jgi:glycerol-3-phosphate dehydrogenase subunit B
MALPKSHVYDPNRVFDVMVIGSGIAGMAASLFAVNRNLSTVQAGSAGGLLFTSGVFDLLGVFPVEERKVWSNPWEAIDALRKNGVKHPYTRISNGDIQKSFEEVLSFLNTSGISYRCERDRNIQLITSMGTIKPTYCVPQSMWHGAEALKKKAPCLIVDFKGLREFSSKQICTTLEKEWPSLMATSITFPKTEGLTEVHPVHLAQTLESATIRKRLSDLVKTKIGDAGYVGFPAVLGIKRTPVILRELREMIGVPVFEIPMMPASVPGFRLKEIFDSALPQKGVLRLIDKRVESLSRMDDGNFLINVGGEDGDQQIRTRCVILATGRFMGKGLVSNRLGIHEPLFNLPLHRPESRIHWHHEKFLHPEGHPINRAGVQVDDSFRPVDDSGRIVQDNLFIAGSILAHQDWMRMKCGSGLAISTAYAAVNALLKGCSNTLEKAGE